MKFQSNRGIFLGIILFSITASTFGQFLVVPPKAEVIVPEVTGMMRAEAEKILTDLGLKVTTAEQEDPDFPDGTVLSQRPAAGKKAAAGDEVLILLSNPRASLRLRVKKRHPGYRSLT